MKKTILIATVFAMLAVILGAFAAHGLKARIPEKVNIFQTGVTYQYYHSFALFIVAILMKFAPRKPLKIASYFFIAGIICFSGSLYLLACRELLGIENWAKILGPITPLGGTFFIIAWAFVLLAAFGIREN